MRLLCEAVEGAVQAHADALDQVRFAVRSYLAFFREHPEFVELLMQERAEFRDRKESTYFAHRDEGMEHWEQTFRGLIDAGRVREMPPRRIIETIGALVYGAMFVHHFTKKQPLEEQADDIFDFVWHAIATDSERAARPSNDTTSRPRHPKDVARNSPSIICPMFHRERDK